MLTMQIFETKNMKITFDKSRTEVMIFLKIKDKTCKLRSKEVMIDRETFYDLKEIFNNTHFIFSKNNN